MNVLEGVQRMTLFISCWLCPDPFVPLITQSGSSVTSCCQLSVYFLPFFFLRGIPLSDISSPVLVSSNPAQSPWSFSSALQFQLHSQCSSRSLCFPVKCCFFYPTYSLHYFPTIHTYCLSSQCIHSHLFFCILTLSFPNTRPTQCHSFSCVFKTPCIDPSQ